MKKVEVIKLGNILPMDKINSNSKPMIMIISDGGEIIDYYNQLLIDSCSEEYSFLKTSNIIKQPVTFSNMGKVDVGGFMSGFCDGDPIVGESYTINNSSWHTSRVDKIIDNNIIITKNSVYVIHNLSELRNKKLNNLGIN